MNNEEKAREIVKGVIRDRGCVDMVTDQAIYNGAMTMAEWKDEQPIMESDGWHTEEPTENGWYLVDTPDFPKNCHCVVAEWDNDAKNFYDEHSDFPIKFHRWKLIEKG